MNENRILVNFKERLQHQMPPSVAVLISTYNPNPKYFADQIQSLEKQDYPVKIFIRDDGSSNPESIRSIHQASRLDNIEVYWGKNVGYGASFLTLLKQIKEFDYYAFCDQDDIWLSDKIRRGVDALSSNSVDASWPILYFSHYDFYDKNMNFISHSAFDNKTTRISFANALVDVNILGMTMMLNNPLRSLMIQGETRRIVSHDWWAYLVSAGCGQIIEDTKVTVKYRRHENNSSGIGTNFASKIAYRLKRFLVNDDLADVRMQIECFSEHFNALLSDQNKQILELFLPHHKFRKAIKKMLWPHLWRLSVAEDLQCRVIFLIGRL